MDAESGDGPRPGAVLRGYRVGVVANRGSQAQTEALLGAGAEPVHAPAVEAVPVARVEALEASIDEAVNAAPALIVLTSAAGIQGWLSAAEELGRDTALREILAAARVVAQGPDTAAAATSLEVMVDEVVADDTDEAGRSLATSVGDLAGRSVAVQVDGGHRSTRLLQVLSGSGATGFEVTIPAAGLPADQEPVRRLVEDLVEARVEALTLTAPDEIRNLVTLARGVGCHDDLVAALNDGVAVVCLTRAVWHTAASLGVRAAVRPERARVGAMVDTLIGHLKERRQRFELGGVEVTLQGSLAVIDGTEVWLAERERALLAVLARRPGMVVAKAELLRRVWRSDGAGGADGHAVEVAVGRLRRRLGAAGAALETVPRRGYRLAPD